LPRFVIIHILFESDRMKRMQRPSPYLRMLFVLMMPLKMKASDLRV